jgi:hypothetical protein
LRIEYACFGLSGSSSIGVLELAVVDLVHKLAHGAAGIASHWPWRFSRLAGEHIENPADGPIALADVTAAKARLATSDLEQILEALGNDRVSLAVDGDGLGERCDSRIMARFRARARSCST